MADPLHMYDDLPALDAIINAWTRPGVRPDVHRASQHEIRQRMPLLARALDRAAGERGEDGHVEVSNLYGGRAGEARGEPGI